MNTKNVLKDLSAPQRSQRRKAAVRKLFISLRNICYGSGLSKKLHKLPDNNFASSRLCAFARFESNKFPLSNICYRSRLSKKLHKLPDNNFASSRLCAFARFESNKFPVKTAFFKIFQKFVNFFSKNLQICMF